MGNTGLFVAGILVTLVVVSAMGVLVWGLRMERRAELADRRGSRPPDDRPS